jgi:hypothetical protein
MGDDGFPILPDHAKMDSDTRKAVMRAFLNWHYRESANVNRPGKLTAMDRGLQQQTERPGSLEGGYSKARIMDISFFYLSTYLLLLLSL